MGNQNQPSDAKPSNVVAGKKNTKKFRLSRKNLAVLLVVLLVLGAISASVILINPSTNKESGNSLGDKCHPNSDGSITREAATILNPAQDGSLRGLEKAIEPIKAEPAHEQDPNCLYPILRYYMAITDPENAKIYFDKFEAVYAKGFATDFYAFDLETLRSQVDHLKTIAEEAKSSQMFSETAPPENPGRE